MNQLIASINMIKQQLRTSGVLNEKIIDLYEHIHRDHFVPENYKAFAYSDLQIELPHSQRMMTPLEEALLLQSLNLKGHEIILEIGTGSGFLTALLSRLGKKVISVEYFAELADEAHKKLSSYDFNNIEIICGDGNQILTEYAPYDVIIYTSACKNLEPKIYSQVAPNGKIFSMIGQSPVIKACVNQLDEKNNWQTQFVFNTDLPALITNKDNNSFVF